MAPIPKPVNQDPPADSSSDDEETESSDAEPQQPSQSKKPAAPESEQEGSESESDSDSDSDSEDGSDSDSKIVKPTASKPIDDSLTKSSNAKAKAKAAPATPVSKLTAGKRAAAGETEQSKKDAKKPPRKEENTEDTKKQRLWSDDDEVALLDGMIEFSEKRRVDPTRDLAAFHDFIKKSLSIEVAQSQLKDKIGRLRRKFAKANEEEVKSFPKVHEREVFDLSKKIWGTNKRQAEAELSNRKAKMFNNGDSSSKYLGEGNRMEGLDWTDGMGIEDIGKFVATKGLDYVQGSERGELEKMWKEVHIGSLELLAKRSKLMHDQAKLMVKAMKD
ncbi:Probable transcription factor At1g61730 [Linum grandiflorum]